MAEPTKSPTTNPDVASGCLFLYSQYALKPESTSTAPMTPPAIAPALDCALALWLGENVNVGVVGEAAGVAVEGSRVESDAGELVEGWGEDGHGDVGTKLVGDADDAVQLIHAGRLEQHSALNADQHPMHAALSLQVETTKLQVRTDGDIVGNTDDDVGLVVGSRVGKDDGELVGEDDGFGEGACDGRAVNGDALGAFVIGDREG